MERLRAVKNKAKVDLTDQVDFLNIRFKKFINEDGVCILDNYGGVQLIFKIMVELYLNSDRNSIFNLLSCYDPELKFDLEQEIEYIETVCRRYFVNKYFDIGDLAELTLDANVLTITYLTYEEFVDDPY